MNFAFTDDQILLKNSARALLDEHCKPEHVRAMQDDARGYGEALWGEMAKLGWLGLPFPEHYGGAGLGLVELALLHEEMGGWPIPGPSSPLWCWEACRCSSAARRRKKRSGCPPSPPGARG